MKPLLANLSLAALGLWASSNLEQRARIFAAVMTGLWFTLQIVFLLCKKYRELQRVRRIGRY